MRFSAVGEQAEPCRERHRMHVQASSHQACWPHISQDASLNSRGSPSDTP